MKTMERRFWPKVDKNGPNGCWLWKGAKNERGYGLLRVNDKSKKAAYISYKLAFGPIPDSLFVLHHCDNPSCVNPEHLFLGTQRDNIQDMIKKGRSGVNVLLERQRNGKHWPGGRPRLAMPPLFYEMAQKDLGSWRITRALEAQGMVISKSTISRRLRELRDGVG